METFLECETTCRKPAHRHVFVESLAEIDPRKVAEVVRRTRHKKNNTSATHFFALSPKPIARFRWKRARLSFQASTLPAKFHPNPSKFPRCISENVVPDRYNIADNKRC